MPKTLAEADKAYKMLWEWKLAGESWEVIEREWEKLAGSLEPYGVLASRLVTMKRNFADRGTLDVSTNPFPFCGFL